jgi:hypothetical protein
LRIGQDYGQDYEQNKVSNRSGSGTLPLNIEPNWGTFVPGLSEGAFPALPFALTGLHRPHELFRL